MTPDNGHETIRLIYTYERLSGILWIILGIFQVLTIFVLYLPGPLVGIWNMHAGRSRLRMAARIRARDSQVPAAFEPMNQLLLIGGVNLLLGGVIGVFFVALDLYVRDKVLANRALFGVGG